jgi:regulation of enolase protein 1 (concanavalin A-like superfamily)
MARANVLELQWNADGDGVLDQYKGVFGPPSPTPVWLRVTRAGTSFNAQWSADGQSWISVGTASLPSAAAVQDAGMTATAANGAEGPPTATALFSGFAVK